MHDVDPIGQRVEQLLQEGELRQRGGLRRGFRLFICRRSVISRLISRIALGCPSVSRISACRLSTITVRPSGRVWISSPSHAPSRSSCSLEVGERRRETRLEEDMGDLPQRFLRAPAIERFRPFVPRQNAVGQIAHQDGVVRQIDQVALQLQTPQQLRTSRSSWRWALTSRMAAIT